MHEQSTEWLRRSLQEKIRNARLAGRENAQGGIAIARSVAKEAAEKARIQHEQEVKDLKDNFEAEVEDLRQEVEKSRDELGALRGLRQKALADAELARQRLVASEGELAQRIEDGKAAEAEIKRLSGVVAKERERSKMFRQAVKDTQRKLNTTEDELADTKDMLEAEVKSSDHLKGRVRELEELSEDMQRELSQVDEKISKVGLRAMRWGGVGSGAFVGVGVSGGGGVRTYPAPKPQSTQNSFASAGKRDDEAGREGDEHVQAEDRDRSQAPSGGGETGRGTASQDKPDGFPGRDGREGSSESCTGAVGVEDGENEARGEGKDCQAGHCELQGLEEGRKQFSFLSICYLQSLHSPNRTTYTGNTEARRAEGDS